MSTSSSRYARNEPTGFIRRWLWRHARLYVLVPSWPGIGNAAEEIFFSMILARQLNKRVLVIFPIQLPWPLRLPLLRAGVLDVSSPEILMRPGGMAVLPLRVSLSLYFGSWRLLQKILQPLKVGIPDRLAIPRFGQESLWCPEGLAEKFDWQAVHRLDWHRWINLRPEVSLPKRTIRKGTKVLRELGIDDAEWFVCLHVRDGGFHGDQWSSQPRNGTVERFAEAIGHIARQGGKVVRMGGPDMCPAPPINGLVDYATSGLASPRADAFLMKHCRYFIGMQSGLYDLAPIFGKARLVANMYNAAIGLPFRSGDAGFFKRTFTPTGERTWIEILKAPRIRIEELTARGITPLDSWSDTGKPDYVFSADWSVHGVQYLERTSVEITDYVQEFTAHLARDCDPKFGQPIGPELVDALRDFISRVTFSEDPVANVAAKYRFASRITPHLSSVISR